MSSKETLLATVLAGATQILRAALEWRGNALRLRASRIAWGPSPLAWATLPGLATVAVAVAVAEPYLPHLADVFPPLAFIGFVPDIVLLMLFSPSALFAYLVVWRLRRLRMVRSREGLDGALCFDAVAVPVGATALILVAALEGLRFFLLSPPESPSPFFTTLASLVAAALRQLAGIAIIVGAFSALKRLKDAFGKALGAVLFLMVAEIGLAFATSWISMFGWREIGSIRPTTQALLYLGAISVLWAQSRSAWQGGPARVEAPAPPPPASPPPPPPATSDAT